MPNKNKNIPKRRFKEFENADAWELRKLGDTVIEIIAGGDIDKNKVVEFGKYPIYANSHSGDGIVGYYDDFYRVNGPAVTVTGRGEVGFAKAREIDFTPVVRLLAIRSKHNHYFLENAINLHGVTVESTGVPQLTVPQLSAYRIYFPFDIQEENQIGTFFSTLDRHITLHQRKLDKLKSVKQAYLSEMFPAEGERVPKRRFPGFTDDWELRKLGEVGTVAMCRRIFKEQTSEHGEIPFYKIGTFGGTPDAFIARELFEEFKDKYSYPNIGDILISASGSIGRTVEFLGEDEYFQDSNIVWLKHDGKINNIFLKQFYSIVKWSGIEGSTIKRLYNENILNTEIALPSLPEQEAIGTFFSTLDQQITLHQRKLEKLKNLKKALLNELFV
ncbi:TPA: restriction endonuclease subunit S [Streptococcus suis]|nr:restriction endonuclease subunit S [Streptococcus suis]